MSLESDIRARAEAVLEAAAARGLMLATAESCTGGGVAAALTDIPGSSRVLERGFVTYSNLAKTELLGVDPALIAAHGAVSESVARAMAEGALRRAPVALAIGVTGVAGPGGTAAKPEGLVEFAVACGWRATRAETHHFGALGRDIVRRESVLFALDLLLEALQAKPITAA